MYSSANRNSQRVEDVEFRFHSTRLGVAIAMFGTGNNDERTPSPALFLRCRFTSNKATENGGALETVFGVEAIVSSVLESNSAGMTKGQNRQVCFILLFTTVLARWVDACDDRSSIYDTSRGSSREDLCTYTVPNKRL